MMTPAPEPMDTKLPQEMINQIIDHLSGERKTLISCSQTCRRLSYAARSHLFAAITVNSKEQLHALSNSALPITLVQSLNIVVGVSSSPIHPFDVFTAPCWSLFSHITRLHLNSFDVIELHPIQAFFDNFPNLEILSIIRSRFFSLHSLIRAIHSFRYLTKLFVLHLSWSVERAASEPDIVSASELRRLSSLVVSQLDAEAFLPSLMRLQSNFYLKTYTSLVTIPNSVEPRFIEMCPELHDLYLPTLTPAQVDSLDLRAHNSVELIVLPYVSELAARRPWFPSLLTTIGSNRVRSLTICLEFDGSLNMRSRFLWVWWEKIDALLSQPKFCHLEKVEVNMSDTRRQMYTPPEAMCDMQDEVERLLPKLAARRILHGQIS